MSSTSSAPRRSLRIRNANVPEGPEKQEPDKIAVKPAAAAPKRRASAIAASKEDAAAAAENPPIKKSAKGDKKKKVEQGQGAPDDDQKMDTVEEKEEEKEDEDYKESEDYEKTPTPVTRVRKMRNNRKKEQEAPDDDQKMDTVGGKEDENKEGNKESEDDGKAPTPVKRVKKMRNRRKNGQDAKLEEDEDAAAVEKPAAPAASRPKRLSSLAAAEAIKKVTVSNASRSDSSEHEHSEVEMEDTGMGKIKNQRKNAPAKEPPLRNGQRKVEKKNARKIKSKKVLSESERDTVAEEDEEEVKPKRKNGQRKEDTDEPKKNPPKKSTSKNNEPIVQRPPSLDRPHEKVRLLMDREYEVDRDEMLAWEKRSVQMAKDLRKLEEGRNEESRSGRMKEVMQRVHQFVARCLKDRTREMGAMESVRLCHVLKEEFDEEDRRRKLTPMQRMKDTIANEQKQRDREAEETDEHDEEEEDEWEDMETVDGEGVVKTMEVHVEKEKDMSTHWKSKWLKQEVNRAMRTRYENVHKAHLISYMSHLRHLAAVALSHSSKHGEIPLAAIALSVLPEEVMKKEKESEEGSVDEDEYVPIPGIELIEWWWKEFEESEAIVRLRSSPNISDPMFTDDENEGEEEEGNGKKKQEKSEEERLSEGMMERRYRSYKEAAIMFFSLAASAGYTVRLVCRCEVVSKKVPESAEAQKQREEEEKKDKEEGETKTKKKRSQTVYEESRKFPIVSYWIEMWDEPRDQWATVDVIRPEPPEEDFVWLDEEEEWCIRHKEPLNACMEKDGKVLYVLAIDNEFGIRDVSARYIHSTNFVSKEFRQRRANQEWMNELWEMEPFRSHSVRSRLEDDDWLSSLTVEMPKQVGAFKDHPLYVLDKDVLKMQRIFPYNVEPVGEIRGYKVYSRKYLRPTKPAKWYEKMGRQVRDDEPPVGEKKLTNPMTGESVMQGLFGYWQTDPWKAGEVVNGKIPRNEFDNIYMYQPKEMCPEGGIYLTPSGLQRVAFELGKDFVPAVIGWQYKNGNIIPILEGAVFVKADLPDLLAAWKECERRWKEEEKKARTSRSLAGWKKLIRGMLRLAAMRKEFEPIENKKKKGTKLGDDAAVRAEEAAAWPQQRYGADFFDL